MRRLTRPAHVLLILLTAFTATSVAAIETVPAADAAMQIVGDDPQEDERAAEASSSAAEYGMWTLVAVCLILAGFLLVRIERWQARRIPDRREGFETKGRTGGSVPG